MPPPNRTRLALLGFLSWGPMSGYGLKKIIEGSISNFWTESYGQIYPMLRQLEGEGLAKARSAGKGGRSRTVYAITAAGHAELARWLESPVEPRPLRNELLLKLFFGTQAKPAAARRHLEVYRDEREALLARYARIRATLEGIASPPAHLPYWLITLSYGESEARAQLRWADSALATLTPAPRKEAHAAARRRRTRPR
jgi:PadR family transcriptional regulator, regulatory protein AphA